MQRGRNEGLTETRLQQDGPASGAFPLLCVSIHIRDVVNGVAEATLSESWRPLRGTRI
jgi:hypothetical protein